MKNREFLHILGAIILFSMIGALSFLIEGRWDILPLVFLFAVIIILVSVFAKKLMAYALDADVEHEIWNVSRYGIKKQ